MTSNLRLAARLVRGAGASDLTRLLMMAVGVALSVAALLVAVTVPRALGSGADREASRMPVWGDPSSKTAHFEVATTQTATTQGIWAQIRLSGGDTSSPIPPGLAALPAPGHSKVSPALLRLLADDPRRALALGVVDEGVIADDGLARPDELVSYSRLSPTGSTAAPASTTAPPASAAGLTQATGGESATPSGPGSTVVAFGDRSLSGGASSALGLEAMLLVALPALLFLSVCARLSVTSRRARLASLRLIGVSLDRCARIFSGELTLVATLGALAGIGVHVLATPWLSTGVLGVTWFSSDTELNPGLAAACLLTCGVLTSVVARRSMLRHLRTGEHVLRSRPWPVYVGGTLALVGGAFLTIVALKVLGAAPEDPVLDPSTHVQLVLGACLSTMVGLLIALPGLVTRFAQWISTKGVPLSIRLGARQAATNGRLSARLLAALVATVMAVGLSSAFLRSTYLDAVGDPHTAVLHVDLADASPEQRRAIAADLPATSEIFLIGTQRGDGQQVSIYVTSCERYVHTYSESGAHCVPGPVRVGQDGAAGTVQAGATISIPQVGRSPITLPAPRDTIGGVGGMTVVIPPGTAPWAATAPNASITAVVPTDEADAVQARLQHRAPDAIIQRVTKDPLSLARYVEQSAVLRGALTLAYLLCILTFIFALAEARWAGRRTLVAQRAIGVPAGVTRRANMVQAALPVVVGTMLAVPAIAAAGIAFLAFWGSGNARDLTFWAPITGLAAGAVGTTAAVGWAMGRSPLELQLLSE